MRARLYVPNDQTRVRTHDLLAWMAWFQSANRIVAFTTNRMGEAVSTIFLGLADDGVEEEPPLLFQTVVADGPLAGVRMLYATWDETVEGHQRLVALVSGQEASKHKVSCPVQHRRYRKKPIRQTQAVGTYRADRA